MSIKGKIVMAAAALTLAGGLGAAGTLTANAATKDCGQSCTNLFSSAFGTAAHPAFVLGALSRAGQAGQPIILAPASGANKGEDFSVEVQGLVREFYQAGLVSGGLNALYGNLFAYEIQYMPGGSPSGLCVGVGATPGSGTRVVLQWCGVSARTVWIADPVKTSSGSYFALISAATDRSFAHPYVLTTPRRGMPLVTAKLAKSSARAALARQLWGFDVGALPSGTPRRPA